LHLKFIAGTFQLLLAKPCYLLFNNT
jgi:hypothetical protein